MEDKQDLEKKIEYLETHIRKLGRRITELEKRFYFHIHQFDAHKEPLNIPKWMVK